MDPPPGYGLDFADRQFREEALAFDDPLTAEEIAEVAVNAVEESPEPVQARPQPGSQSPWWKFW